MIIPPFKAFLLSSQARENPLILHTKTGVPFYDRDVYKQHSLPHSDENKLSLDYILSPEQRKVVAPSISPTAKRAPKPSSHTTWATSFPRKSSKLCIVEGCQSRAKHLRKCWRHGGSFKCNVPDCLNRAKSKGLCWSHGGGTTCKHDGCTTIAVSRGSCWAHGGGKRCRMEGCSRPAFERTDNLCVTHYKRRLFA